MIDLNDLELQVSNIKIQLLTMSTECSIINVQIVKFIRLHYLCLAQNITTES